MPLVLTGMRIQERRVRIWWRARRRAGLAAGYERVVAAAERPVTRLSPIVPVSQPAVRRARSELLAISAVLRSSRRVHPAGLVAARALLSDGSGPLYLPGDLDAAARRVLDLLEGGPRP